METFEQYLQGEHAGDYHGTDDDMPDAYESWVSQLDTQEVMDYAQNWGERQYTAGRIAGMDEVLKGFEPHMANLKEISSKLELLK